MRKLQGGLFVAKVGLIATDVARVIPGVDSAYLSFCAVGCGTVGGRFAPFTAGIGLSGFPGCGFCRRAEIGIAGRSFAGFNG